MQLVYNVSVTKVSNMFCRKNINIKIYQNLPGKGYFMAKHSVTTNMQINNGIFINLVSVDLPNAFFLCIWNELK